MDSKTVLVVDDEAAIAGLLKVILSEAGMEVELASNGQQAMELIEKTKFDLVISDIRMPVMDGFQLLEQVKRRDREIKVILMTGYTEDYEISDALVLGADDYITKPFEDTKILIAVQNVFQI